MDCTLYESEQNLTQDIIKPTTSLSSLTGYRLLGSDDDEDDDGDDDGEDDCHNDNGEKDDRNE